ncbi:aminotransferase class I/II-fold pyridoxal phosphate-dependent enzyme [Goodfellowiella coeruleoviolacea]|uniref:Aspartate/methionine/tyrosine aminotransferase n=1 Tax=Goodfellowiella coeruleoviolacea TaxID=334858 RepID=A0AAE3GDW9_9PSEU|nr:pyridoxal phosphate-dependent aminotransferase [Goodfellowiella coeruleoviolacea]MCP2165509.1 Aspartate/methionine/tyrosine aminotransferase [Goodfellowiella coeruleoviolacea]
MTGQLDVIEPKHSVANLTAAQQDLLARTADEEQRSVLYRELLRARRLPAPTDLSVAENVLLAGQLREYVFDELNALPTSAMRYATSYGTDSEGGLRGLVAERLTDSLGATVRADDVFGTAGVASALECVALALQEPLRDKPVVVPTQRSARPRVPVPRRSPVLLPAPFWQGFYWSFEQVPKLRCVPVHLEHAGAENFRLTLADIQRAYYRLDRHNRPKLLVLTNPHNPLGVNYDEGLLESVYHWALSETDMHIVSDEIYCHSQLLGALPPFVSALALNATQRAPERVHVVWGFAKDFGLSGFRTGFVISRSPHVRQAMLGTRGTAKSIRSLAWFTPFDSLKQFAITTLLTADGGDFWDTAVESYQADLTDSFRAVAEVLDGYGIRYVRGEDANTAQFVWLDLREFLPADEPPEITPANALLFGDPTLRPTPEERLAEHLLARADVKLLPGTTLSCAWPGYFRLCFTAWEQRTVVAAVDRMCRVLTALGRG